MRIHILFSAFLCVLVLSGCDPCCDTGDDDTSGDDDAADDDSDDDDDMSDDDAADDDSASDDDDAACESGDPATHPWELVQPGGIIVNDFEPWSTQTQIWYYTRIGSDRGLMGADDCATPEDCIHVDDGTIAVDVPTGWSGVWTSVLHTDAEAHSLEPSQVLGPAVTPVYQPTVTGVELDVLDGTGTLKVEFKDTVGAEVFAQTHTLSPPETVAVTSQLAQPVHLVNWLVDGTGSVEIGEMRLSLDSPEYTLPEAVFLWSYAHLYQTYDPATGLTRDRARWPASNYSSVQTMGTFALATAMGADLGYLDPAEATATVQQVWNAISAIPRHEPSGLLPHFVSNWDITENTEYSSVDTVIALVSLLVAQEMLGEDASGVRAMLADIDWDGLTAGGTQPVSMGFEHDGNDWVMLESSWDVFGSESFMISLVASATLGSAVDLDYVDPASPRTWDGSGFNDWMATLFFAMDRTDAWGVDWPAFLADSTCAQLCHHDESYWGDAGLFGHSASEIPEPWTVDPDQVSVYRAWGVGGYEDALTTIDEVGTPIFSPHYASLIMAEYPAQAERLWLYLIDQQAVFTPMNNVESFTVDETGEFTWNSLKGSWNLSLQTLGAARALYAVQQRDYPPYDVVRNDPYLGEGYTIMMP